MLYEIKNVKIRDNGATICITWNWPPQVEVVYINDIMYTLQEYKKSGGYTLPKSAGVSTFCINAVTFEDGKETVHITQNKAVFTCKTDISLEITEQKPLFFGKGYKNYKIALQANYDMPANVIEYEKLPAGVKYPYGEPLNANEEAIRIIQTSHGEYLRFYIKDEFLDLYILNEG